MTHKPFILDESHPPQGVCWHRRQKAWRVSVKRKDFSVTPPRIRKFYHEFKDFEAAIRVRDYVDRMLRGPNAKSYLDGKLPSQVTPLNIIHWLVGQGTVDVDELPQFTKHLKSLDKPSLSG